nr:lytic murein transglycosylase [Corynebacterium sp. TAE3-ERU12]
MTMFTGPVTMPFTKEPIPADVPPAAAEPAPAVATSIPEGRPANQLAQWAQPISDKTRISVQAVQAYGLAERMAAEEFPECHLHWNTLAGLGYVETRHGTYGGDWLNRSKLDAEGKATPAIIGVPLDGSPGFAEIRDTDDGVLDQDKQWDRAVGPMQFIPESWRTYGVDASGDGIADPNQIDDAAASAARLLCANGRDLDTEQGWAEAIRAYNYSGDYLVDVRDAAANYALGQPA